MSLVMSNLIIINNDPVEKTGKVIRGYKGLKDYEKIEQMIDFAYDYKTHVERLSHYFDNLFSQAKAGKVVLEIDKKLIESCENCKISFITIKDSKSVLGTKKKRKGRPKKHRNPEVEAREGTKPKRGRKKKVCSK